MAKTIIVCGYGVGISKAVAQKFGAEGFSVALVARNAERLAAGVKELEAKGVKAAAFPADCGDAKAVAEMVSKARTALGPITALVWTAYAGDAGDLLAADAAAVHRALDVATTGLLAAVKAALPDLKAQKGAVLVTNGGFGAIDPNVDAMCVKFGAMGLALANAAKNKLVGLLHQKLKDDGVYVGQVMVMGVVKGTAFDQGGMGSLEASSIADKFWALYDAREDVTVTVG